MADAELLTDWQRKNKEYKQRHALTAHRETDTMARLHKFTQNLQRKQAATKAAAIVPVAVTETLPETAQPSVDEVHLLHLSARHWLPCIPAVQSLALW